MAKQATEKASKPTLQFGGKWNYAPAPESTDHFDVPAKHELFVGGAWVAPASGKYFDTTNPATTDKLSEVGHADAADVDRAVKAARKAFASWSKTAA